MEKEMVVILAFVRSTAWFHGTVWSPHGYRFSMTMKRVAPLAATTRRDTNAPALIEK
ncbi:MAG: hypothetical protein JW768_14320 [Chitinispirillaceae bacterium]|nr:hypothetical protein [Chitinispirillaceae bacterium]